MDKILNRSDKVAFMEIGESGSKTLTRMRGFTELSVSKNPVEYSRRYVDENAERSDVTGYAPSISYAFDRFSDDAVHKEIVAISDGELTFDGAIRKIVVVDLSSPSTSGGSSFNAVSRNFSIIPDSEGDSTDAYTYSGTMKANGDFENIVVESTDGWKTCTIKAN